MATQSDYTGREEADTGNSITGLHQNRAPRHLDHRDFSRPGNDLAQLALLRD